MMSIRFKTALCALVLLVTVVSDAKALKCFETNEDGEMVEGANAEWTYCVLLPETLGNAKFVDGRAFGVGPNSESTHIYDKLFEQNTSSYNVLTMCIYERYDFRQMLAKYAFKEPEFLLRCFCNYDNCNHQKNFFAYIQNMHDDSVKGHTKAALRASRTNLL